MNKLAIFGVPRSGTSWLSQIFNSHPDVVMRFQPLFSYSHKGKLTEHSTADQISDFFDEVLNSSDEFTLMTSKLHGSYPKFDKSPNPTMIAFKETRYLNLVHNLLTKCKDIKVIGIVRNPLATLASWMQAPKEFSPDWDIHREWRTAPSKNMGRSEEYFGFEQWKKAASEFIQYQRDYSDIFKMVRYDQLNSNTDEVVKQLFSFCGLDMHSQVTKFIFTSKLTHDMDPYSVFRGKANDTQWQDKLPEDIVEQIRHELINTPLQMLLS